MPDADAALRGFQSYGPGTAQEVQGVLDLISQIAKDSTA